MFVICALTHGQSSPRLTPSCSTRPRPAIVRPAVKPPPIPAYASERREQTPQTQVQPTASPARQKAPQGCPPTSLKPLQVSGQKAKQLSPPLPGPAFLSSKDSESQSQFSAIDKQRPDPPNRPPPPRPIKRPLVVNAYVCIFE